MQQLLNQEIADFVVKYMPQYASDMNVVKDYILKHDEFNTLDYAHDDEGLVYVARYNVNNTGRIIDVVDLAVRPDMRGCRKLLRIIMFRVWMRFPSAKWVRYYRTKYNRNFKMYELGRLLRIRSN